MPVINLRLISTHHGFNDYDVIGHKEIHRVCVGHDLKNGDIFNVYGPESTKRGAKWLGSLEKSFAIFSGLKQNSIHVSKELNILCLFELDENQEATGTVMPFCSETCRQDALTTTHKTWSLGTSSANSFGYVPHCETCGCEIAVSESTTPA